MFKSFPFRSLAVIGTTAILPFVAANHTQARNIEVYDIPKEASSGHVHAGPAGGQGGAVDPHGGMTAAMPTLKVAKLPEGWTENPNPGSMRAASYLVSDGQGNEAEVAVIPMPGMSNIELQLVNMWREQAKLPAVTEAELGGQSVPVAVGKEEGKLFEVASTDPVIGGQYKARILVAMLKQTGTTWFFKFAGEDQLVASNKDRFIEFLKGVSFEAPAAMPAGHPPVGGNTGMGMGQGMMGGGGATVAPGSGDHPEWQVPGTWTEVAHSPFLVAKFQAKSESGATADINVSTSPGDGGGLLPNINRWRGQLSLAALDAAGVEKVVSSLDLPSGKASLVDFSGEGAENSEKLRCIAVVVPVGGETWFYKIMGSEALVAREKDALVNFVRSVKY